MSRGRKFFSLFYGFQLFIAEKQLESSNRKGWRKLFKNRNLICIPSIYILKFFEVVVSFKHKVCFTSTQKIEKGEIQYIIISFQPTFFVFSCNLWKSCAAILICNAVTYKKLYWDYKLSKTLSFIVFVELSNLLKND